MGVLCGGMLAELRTERLWLRRWREADREPFAALNAEPDVVRYLPGALTRAESDALIERIEAHFDEHGFGLWAVVLGASDELLGFVGLMKPVFDAHFTPCVEVGWRLRSASWGQGYASEGARAAVHAGFTRLALQEIVSFTVPANLASRRVMTKIGMVQDGEFDHPGLPARHPLRRHVLYRLRQERGTRSA